MEKKINSKRLLMITWIVLISIMVGTIGVWAWLYQGRTVASVGEISNPTAIHLSAGNLEDSKFIDLSGIDVSKGTYKDFVFCVTGENVSTFKIQLAFTTNNQFEYEIYPAILFGTENPSISDVPANAVARAEYKTHPANESEAQIQVYYSPNGTSPVVGKFINRDGSESEMLAYEHEESAASGDYNMHDDTYKNGAHSAYDYVNKYAEPLYWQTSTPITTIPVEATDLFCNYYILRVKWDSGTATNDKETDIIYITAKNMT